MNDIDHKILSLLQSTGIDIHPALVAEIKAVYRRMGRTIPTFIANRLPDYDNCDGARLLAAIGIASSERNA